MVHKNTLTVLTVTLKGVVAVDVASMVGVVLSEDPPGTLRRRPVLSGGDSANREMDSVLTSWNRYHMIIKWVNMLGNKMIWFSAETSRRSILLDTIFCAWTMDINPGDA